MVQDTIVGLIRILRAIHKIHRMSTNVLSIRVCFFYKHALVQSARVYIQTNLDHFCMTERQSGFTPIVSNNPIVWLQRPIHLKDNDQHYV